MIIPVRCFTCGKVCDRPRGGKGARAPLPCFPSASAPAAAAFFSFSFAHTQNHSTPYQVIGNKWDTYLELLQADYSET